MKFVFAWNSVCSVEGVDRLLSHTQATCVLHIGVHERFDSGLGWGQKRAPEQTVGGLGLHGQRRAIADIWTYPLAEVELSVVKPQHACCDGPDPAISFFELKNGSLTYP